jgi:hypothetical protein
MIKTIRIFCVGFISACVICAAVAFWIATHQNKQIPAKMATVKGVSGETARIDSINVTREIFSIRTEYVGPGVSDISIPISTIPQAAAWENKRRGVTVLYSARGCITAIGSYRIESFTINGGVRAPVRHITSWHDYDVCGGFGLWF